MNRASLSRVSRSGTRCNDLLFVCMRASSRCNFVAWSREREERKYIPGAPQAIAYEGVVRREILTGEWGEARTGLYDISIRSDTDWEGRSRGRGNFFLACRPLNFAILSGKNPPPRTQPLDRLLSSRAMLLFVDPIKTTKGWILK